MGTLIQRRRGTRVRAQIPVRITSLDPAAAFSEPCHTVLVNTHGCGVRFTRPLKPGMRLKMEDLPGGRTAMAWVASNHPVDEEKKYWIVGIGLESPGNPWCLAPIPPDWDLTNSTPQTRPYPTES